MTRNKAHQFCALLLLLAGMLASCTNDTLGIEDLDNCGFTMSEDDLKDSWCIDLDGVKDKNICRMEVVLSDKKSYFDFDIIDINIDSLYKVNKNIESWGIVKDCNEFKEEGITGDAIKLVSGDITSYWFVEHASKDSLVCIAINDSLRYPASVTMYRSGSAFNTAPRINLTASEVTDLCTEIKNQKKEYDEAYVPETLAGSPTSCWMKEVGDDVKVCNIAIPGTHDSGTFGVKYHAQFAAQTQRYNFKDQWSIGVRSFDLRVRNATNGEARLYHNFIPCEITFKESILELLRLVAKSDECSFAIIKTEGNDMTGHSGRWWMVLTGFLTFGGVSMNTTPLDEMGTRRNIYNEILEAEQQVMREYGLKERIIVDYRPDITMGEARGKMFIINRLDKDIYEKHYPFVGQGILGDFEGLVDLVSLKDGKSNGNPEDTIVYKKCMHVNDLYQDKEEMSREFFYQKKINEFHDFVMKGHFQRVEGNNANILYFNSASASVGDWIAHSIYTPIPDYATLASNVYPTLITDLNRNRTCGIISMDYAGRDKYSRLCLDEIISLAPAIFNQGILLALFALADGLKPAHHVHGNELLNAVLNQARSNVKLDSIRLSKDVFEMNGKVEEQIGILYYPADATDRDIQSWTSSNSDVALVDGNGTIKSKKRGNARVTVKLKNGMQSSSYIVVDPGKMNVVNLGLSVKWGDRNIGAAAPEWDGYFYTWGDTDKRLRNYTPSQYKYGSSFEQYFRYGPKDGCSVLQNSDDPAALLGEGWRMPTLAEVEELMNKAEWTTGSYRGVEGYIVSRNGTSIFLPKTGYFMGNDLVTDNENEGYFWTRNIYKTSTWKWDFANCLYIRNEEKLPYYGTMNQQRYIGIPIRPVYTK